MLVGLLGQSSLALILRHSCSTFLISHVELCVVAEGHMSGLPRTFSGDLSTLQRRKSDSTGSSQSGLPPPPPNFPAPPAPDDDRSSQISGHSSASSNRAGEICCPHRCMHDCAHKGIHVRKTIFVIKIPCSIRTHYILRLVTTTCC